MTKPLPVKTPAPRIIYYPEPTPARPLAQYTPQELAAQRAEQALLYTRWQLRQQVIQERDRRTRRILTRVLLAGLAVVLTVAGLGIWLIYRAITSLSLQPIADLGQSLVGLLVVLLLFGGIGGGCVTIVRHYH